MQVGCFDPTDRMKSTLMVVRHAIDGRLSSVFVGRVEDDCGVNKVLQFCCCTTLLGGFFNAVHDKFLNCGYRRVRSVGNV